MSYSKTGTFGLDISDHSISLVLLNSHRKILVAERERLPFGVINNGQVKDKQFLADVLIKLKKNISKTTNLEKVILSLQEQNVYSHVLNIPHSLINNPKVILKLAQENIPLNLNDAIFDYQTIEKEKKEEKILFVAVEQRMVLDYLEVLDIAGLKAVAIDIDPNSIARALQSTKRKIKLKIKEEQKKESKKKVNKKEQTKSDNQEEKTIETIIKENLPEAEISLDIGAKLSILSIFYNNHIFSPISVPVGGMQMTKIIQEELKIVDFDKADQTKKKITLKSKEFVAVETKMNSLFDKIIHEIKGLVNYFEAHNDIHITTLHLSGGSSRYPGLEEYLSTNLADLNLKVQKAIPQVEYNNSFNPELFINAIGLALRGIQKDPVSCDINLLPAAEKRLLIEQQAKSTIIYSSLIILFISSTLLASFNIVLSRLYFDLDGLEKSNSSLEKIVEGTRYQEIKTHIQSLNDSIQVAKQKTQTTASLEKILKDFYSRVPKTIVINQFSYKKEQNKDLINITGFALTREKVLEIQDVLKNTPFYQNLITPLSNVVTQTNINFKFTFDFNAEAFQQYLIQKQIEEEKARKAALEAELNETLHGTTTTGNKKFTPAFHTSSGNTVDSEPTNAFTEGQTNPTTNAGVNILSPNDQIINTETLQNFNQEGTNFTGTLTEDPAIADQTVEEALEEIKNSDEEYPFQEKIHEKVGDVFVIEQTFTRTDAENTDITTPSTP